MKVGFTGTQVGMTVPQVRKLIAKLIELEPDEFHHGDCIGADSEANDIANEMDLSIVIHPPEDSKKRAYCSGKYVQLREPKPYMERNQDIVDECDVLIAAPKHGQEELRSGTGATIRRAVKAKKEIFILNPI